ncbi:MAG TPA: hypothetical protein VH583_04760 [Vicinamibacterales bacterium]|jgi:hypothetical protein
MKLAIGLAASLSMLVSASVLAQGGSWTGQISDSMCKAKHEEAAEGAGKMADHDCTVSCVKGGSKYVLLVDGKVYQIANQTVAGLSEHAGDKVKVTGELKGDTIQISKIDAQ